jgi:hypothetical protein
VGLLGPEFRVVEKIVERLLDCRALGGASASRTQLRSRLVSQVPEGDPSCIGLRRDRAGRWVNRDEMMLLRKASGRRLADRSPSGWICAYGNV